MLLWLGNIITNSRNTKHPCFVTLFRLISPTKFICTPQIIIRPNLMWIGLAINTLPCIPLVGFNPNSENSFRRIYFLSKIHRLTKLILLLIKIIMKITLHKYCLCYWITIRLRRKNLLYLLMNWILLDLPKTEISWINRPVIRALLLLSRIIIFMWFQVKLTNLFTLRHVLRRVDCLFNAPFIRLSCKSKSEFFFVCLLWKAILTINSTSERLSL